jgi:hypothetical protein
MQLLDRIGELRQVERLAQEGGRPLLPSAIDVHTADGRTQNYDGHIISLSANLPTQFQPITIGEASVNYESVKPRSLDELAGFLQRCGRYDSEPSLSEDERRQFK